MSISEKTEKREFIQKCLTTIARSMNNCRSLLTGQLSVGMESKTELAIKKSNDSLQECIKAIRYYESELGPEFCPECGARIDE